MIAATKKASPPVCPTLFKMSDDSRHFRRLQSRPTEPPKTTLNGRNQPLNGAPARPPASEFTLPPLHCQPFWSIVLVILGFVLQNHLRQVNEIREDPCSGL
jgi:hypothetical protein